MPTDFFTKELSQIYDERNARLAPIADSAHFLIHLVLKNLPARARVLCVGVGTGAEILSLAKAYPGFTFFGVDPSEPMLEVCRTRLAAAGIPGSDPPLNRALANDSGMSSLFGMCLAASQLLRIRRTEA